MLDIDAAIKHCLDIADGQDKCAEISVSEHAKERISQCAADHRQLAEWLQDYKMLRGEYDNCQLNSIEDYRRETARCRSAYFKVNSELCHMKISLSEYHKEIAEFKRLLKLAVEDFETIESNLEYDEHCVIKTHSIRCDECPLSADTIYRCKWRYADEALALIGEDGDTNG